MTGTRQVLPFIGQKLSRFTLLSVLLSLAGGCSADEPPLTQVYPEAYVRPDALRFPDQAVWLDQGQPSEASADWRSPADRSASDGTTSSDASSCPGPQGASCSSCGASSICTLAQGGTCVPELVLSGGTTDKKLLVALATAFVDCWKKQPSDDALCYALDTCGMTGNLSQSDFDDWLCNKSQVLDFASAEDHKAALDLLECGAWIKLHYRPDWKVTPLTAGKKGILCMSYNKEPIWAADRLPIAECQKFPP